ncbi:phosphatidylserine decarboxylase [Azospirillum sp. RWY-5-1]|uniref:Phosphatidylserine decarboxylase proenzyme n=1 Tax=Azospirillum oleiclasticum TaxID=2735135 RepID=A0ABX2T438_9PROT|nr:phosphatidylserine decarboxylase [Azospirillum oleiclasticum]NYZ11901.1 phosphatidylserine decarboxylase [Azospirillum oleiclasticum]NYZ19061.1 phosphatidylserine decarboxylase [Azospirillum oleiclasticum]
MKAIDTVLVPIHRAGWPFVAGFAVVSLVLGLAVAEPLGWIGLVVTAWCVYFFRDPERTTPVRDGLMVSPADGRVIMIVPAVPPPELEMGDRPLTRISIFLNVFNVHVNRVPAEGTVVKTEYRPGKFFNAALDKASAENERMAIRHRLPDGREIAYVQIAGLVARRIICTLAPGVPVRAGERMGLIRFGSRTDVYLPDGVQPLVCVGQTMIGGETVLADLHSPEPQRLGEVRR